MLGATLGPYRILSRLGAGGMGVVYLAEGPSGRVALKVVHEELAASDTSRRRFLREGEIGMRLRHENIVATLEVEEVRHAGRPVVFLAMEYVEGQTLASLIAELGRVPEELCRHVGSEVAKGLAAIHAVGAIHRDVKPDNILITKDRHVVKLMDLGVAKAIEESAQLSVTGDFLGTLHYAAPEQVRGGATVDGRVDLHALGLILFEMATGEHAYRAPDVAAMLARLLHENPRRSAELNPRLSPFFDEVVDTLLAKSPEDRFRSAALLVQVLHEAESGGWWRERASAVRRPSRRPFRTISVASDTPMLGRDAEMSRLRALFDRTAAGDGRVALVEGEAGIGKTRLVAELVATLRRDGADFHFLHGECPPGGIATGVEAYASAFGDAFQEEGDEGAVARGMRATPELIPAFAALLRGHGPPVGAEPLSKEALRTVFVRVATALAEEKPTVLLVDAMQDAPDEAAAIFKSLALAAARRRLLVIGALRPDPPAPWTAELLAMPHATRIGVERLPDAEAARVVHHLLRPRSSMDELPSQVVANADGNPFCVLEILRGLQESGLVRANPDGMLVRTGATGAVRIPSTLREMTAARLAGLADEDREILVVASCCGIEFDPFTVGDVLEMARIPLLRALGRIEKEHRLVRSVGMRFAFDHVRVRETLYSELSEALRCEYHAALGAAIERRAVERGGGRVAPDDPGVIEICGHFLRGTDPRRALPFLVESMRRLGKAGAHAAAVELADLALSAPGALLGAARYEVVRAKAHHLDMLGRVEEERRALDEAHALARATGDPVALMSVYRALGWHLTKLSKYDDAAHWLVDSIEMARARGDGAAEEHATRLFGIVCAQVGRTEEAQKHYVRAREIAQQIGDRNVEAGSSINLAIELLACGRFDQARVEAERGLALTREVGNRRWESNALASLASAANALGLYEEALATCESALRLARETGYRRAEAMALINLAEIAAIVGDAARALESLDAARALCHELGDPRSEGDCVSQTGFVRWQGGDLRGAERCLRDSVRLLQAAGDARGGASALRRLGAVLRRAGRGEEARPLLEEASKLGRDVDSPAVVVLAEIELASLPGGDVAAAETALEERSGRLTTAARMESHHLLWQTAGASFHLDEASRLLDHLVAHAPADRREAMVRDVRLHRDIATARASRRARA